MVVNKILEQAKSKEGVWLKAKEEILAALFGNLNLDLKREFMPTKLYIDDDEVRIYYIRSDDNMLTVEILDHPGLVSIREEDGEIILGKISRHCKSNSYQGDTDDEEAKIKYMEEFFRDWDITEEEYEEMISGGEETLPAVMIRLEG